MFARNFWYVAAWDWEVRRQELMSRKICVEPIVFWRKEDGSPAALEDRCYVGATTAPSRRPVIA